MKAKRSLGIKQKIHNEKKTARHIGLVAIAAILIIVLSVAGLLTHSILTSSSQPPEPSLLKAAIVDQLSLTYPNQTFIETVTDILKQAGYMVEYYEGEKITVEFYRNLPTHGYALIILRVHSTTGGQPVVAFFTSELYDEWKYIQEQLADEAGPVCYSQEEGSKGIYYFGITQKFIFSSIKGNFRNTMIIMMGCEGLNNTKMAEAFIKRGAEVCIGWNQMVSASHTDRAIAHVLRCLAEKNETIRQALQDLQEKVGEDPVYESQLLYYPSSAGEKKIR